MSDEAVQKAAGAIATAHIPEMKPMTSNPRELVRTSEEDPRVQFFRLDEHADVVVWESTPHFHLCHADQGLRGLFHWRSKPIRRDDHADL